MSFEEFRISKRGENNYSYPDWQEWLEKRGITDGVCFQSPLVTEKERIERPGNNFRFVCWGDVTELKLWRGNG